MTSHEDTLVRYALVLAFYGEDSEVTRLFLDVHETASNVVDLVDVTLLYRQFQEQRGGT